jgi:DNA-binding NtrC family response regulator
MLIRAALVLPSAAGERLAGLLATDDVLVTEIAARRPPAAAIAALDVDVLLAGRAALGQRWQSWLRAVRALPGSPDVVILSGDDDPQERAMFLAAGCAAVVHEALQDEALRDALLSLIARRRAAVQARFERERAGAPPRVDDFVCESPAMTRFMSVLRRVAATDASVLILGETGVGKELLARAIHERGPRAGRPFVAINCGALPEGLLESELFGHERGAFTGALHARRGFFELAHSGTLFLDEIGDMPLPLQVRLLRAVQERSIQPIGSERTIAVDVRLIAATNRDLAADVAAKRFRADLFYRLNVVSLNVPPLRERREDIPLLVENNVRHFCQRFSRAALTSHPDTLRALVAYDWPGNVRELVNVVERAVLLCEGETIGLAELPDSIALGALRAAPAPPAEAAAAVALPLFEARARMVADFERRYLEALLRETRGRVGETARRAGLSPRALYTKMRQLGLEKSAFRGRTGSAQA